MVWIDAAEAKISVKLGLLRILFFGELIVSPEGVSAQLFPVYALYRILLKQSP
jgi:hypothetical protein